jgi:hypothetical protein
MGETVEDARAKLTLEFAEYIQKDKCWINVKGWLNGDGDYDAEDIEEWRQVFLKDISTEPQIVETLWIRGSE